MEMEIECGFNTNDETINFGSRRIADNAPYESVTFAAVRIKANASIVPSITSKLNGDRLFYSIDKFFGVFQDEEYSTLKFSHTVDHNIDDFSYCSSSKLLLLFLRDGYLQILKDTTGTFNSLQIVQVVKDQQPNNEKLFINCHFLDDEPDKTSLLLITSIGKILRLDVQEINSLEISVSYELLCEIEGTISHSTYNNGILFLHGSEMWALDLLNNNLISSDAIDIKSVRFAGLMILALLTSGKLAYICPVTLQHYLRDFDYPISSISIVNNERGDVKYIIAISVKDTSGNVQLYLFRQDFSIIYSLTIGNDVILTNMDSGAEEIRYVSLIKSNDKLEELRFQTVIETDPHKRLKRLLRRNMFDEAEQFAKSECLDVNIVTKEKARVIVEKWRTTRSDIDTLISIFDSLDEHSFILECCLIVEDTCENAEDLERILQYACNLQISKKDQAAKEMQYRCNKLLIKFNLFRMIGYCDMNQWSSFSEESLLREVKKFLKQQQYLKAITIYSQLSSEEIQSLDEKGIQEILDILNCIDLYNFDTILPMFLTLTLSWLPSSLQLFMNWLEMKIFQFESQNKDDFPENAIEFLQVSLKCLKMKDPHSYILQKEIKNSSEKVQKLFKILNYLEILKSQYGVRIAVSDLMQEPKIVVRNLLNLDLTIDVYNSILQEFTYKYIIENNLDPDELFFDALIDSLKYQESYWSNIIGSILSCITSQDLKLLAVENIFTRAKLPWSDAVKQIGVQILKECYPKSGNVQQLMAEEPRMTVMSRLEYKFEVSNSSNIDDLQFLVKRIIRCNLPSMISDAFILCEDKENGKIETMRLLLHHFIEKGDFDNVFKLLEEDGMIVKKGLDFVLADFEHMSTIWTISETQNYAHILSSDRLIEKYSSLCENEFASYQWKKKTSSYFVAYKLKTHFNVNITGMNVLHYDKRKNVINEIQTGIIRDYENGTKNVSEMLKSLKLLSTTLGISKEKLYSQCWKIVKINKNELLYRVAKELLVDSVKVKYLCILVVYIMENLTSENENAMSENSFADSYGIEVPDGYYGEFLKLASQLIAKAIVNADMEELAACLKVVPWVDSIFFFNRYKKQDKLASAFADNLTRNSFNPSFASLLAIHKVFTLYTSFIAQSGNINYKYITYYRKNGESMSQENLLNKIKDLEVTLVILNQEGESLLAYKLLTTLQNQLMTYGDLDISIDEALKGMIKKHLIPNLIQQSLLMGEINENLLYTSLRWCDAEETEKFIVRTLQYNRKVPEKVTKISAVAVEMFDFHTKNDLSSYFKQVLLSVSWWERIKHLNIEYDLFFKVTREERLKLVIQSKGFNIKLIKEYCQDYKLENIQSFYLFYLKTYLLNWKPQYEIERNSIGRRTLIMKGNQQKELYQKCNDVLPYIDNKEKVEKMLQEIWSQVNFYYYEVFTCILDLYREKSFKHLKLMLQFLETYERINKPSDTEIEKWFNTFPDCQLIEPLSEFRILFNNTLLESNEIWNIIRKEIRLENYTKWFEAVQAFSCLNVDNICSFLVKEMVAQGILNIIKPGDWVIPKHTHLFNEIENCLDYMKDDMKKITAVYLLLSNTPEGADQVTIAEIAYKYAEEYKMKATDSQISIVKIEKKYQRCLSLRILHMYELAEQQYIDLILNIEQLLLALYHDERIVKKMDNFCQSCPDINIAAEKLAKICNFDLYQFKKKLVTNYLMDSNLIDFSGDISVEYLKKLNSNERSEKERSEKNIKRAAYICSGDILTWHDFLWNEEYKSDKSYFYKARCVKCLLLCADKIAITALLKQSYDSIVNVLDQLTLSSILSKFGLQINLHDMNTWSSATKKLALIGSQDSVLALAQVCKILKIKKLKYWEYIIGNMDQNEMYSDIVEFLDYIKTEDFIYEKFYVDAWTNLIRYTINELLISNEAEMEEKISRDFILIQQCPVMFLVNLEDIIKKCEQMKNPKVAEILIQYIPKSKAIEFTLE